MRFEPKELGAAGRVPQYEAQLGGKVRVLTLDGAVELTIPTRTNSGRTFRLKGKGLTTKHGRGDFLITVEIVLPASAYAEFDELIRRGRDGKPYIRPRISSKRKMRSSRAALRKAAQPHP